MKSTLNVLLFLLMMFGVFGETDGVKFVSVMEGDSVTLNPNLTQLQGIKNILWMFGAQGSLSLSPSACSIYQRSPQRSNPHRRFGTCSTPDGLPAAQGSTIGEIHRNYKTYTSNMMFVYRVKLNQNGSLTINSIRTRHSGLYIAKISHKTGTSYKKFSVVVYESPSVIDSSEAEIKSLSVKTGNPVTLETFSDLFGNDLKLWGFGDKGILIAKCDEEAKITSFYNDAVEGEFKDRLHLHDTGELTIRNTRTTDSGLYKLKIISISGHTSYKKFNVTVSEQTKRVQKNPPNSGLSFGAAIGIIVAVLLVIIAAAVISDHCMVDQDRQMRRFCPKTVSVMEGQHVTLVTNAVIEDGEQVQWSFEGKTITTGMNGDINKTSYGDDETFRDRLELHHQTADLLIKNTKPSDAGVYQLQITSSSGKDICRNYSVVISGNSERIINCNDVVRSEV